MKTTFHYDQVDHSSALEDQVLGKMDSVAHILAAYDADDAVPCSVFIERATGHHRGDVFTIRITVDVQGHTMTAHATGDDLYKLVDEVRDTLHGAVQRFKEQDVARRHAEG